MRILDNKNNMLILKDNLKNLIFFSYKSHIATFDKCNNKLYLTDLWNYSQTTLKQLKEFVNYYTSFTYTTEKEFEKEIKNNKDIIMLE